MNSPTNSKDARPTPYLKNPYYEFKLISHKKCFVYYEIPKCASSTIKSILFKTLIPKNDTSLRYDLWVSKYPELSTNADEVLNNYTNYFKFCFIRNPWARLVSAFYNKKEAYHDLHDISFDTFIHKLDSLQNHHWAPCTDFIPKQNGKLAVDIVGKMECFIEDFSKVLKFIDIEEINIPKMNASQKTDYRIHYNNETREIVRQKYMDDIELGHYEF